MIDYPPAPDGVEHTTFEDGTRVSADVAHGELRVNGEAIERPAVYAETHRHNGTAAAASAAPVTVAASA